MLPFLKVRLKIILLELKLLSYLPVVNKLNFEFILHKKPSYKLMPGLVVNWDINQTTGLKLEITKEQQWEDMIWIMEIIEIFGNSSKFD